ncbi:tyrosine-protein phosphatase [Brevibacterium album]|uniref:tyrosine-protein phosphatase n=1 Tax=Brevibacterium album TaxID=417948 RepID=UPI0004038FA9|nr:tyrosine-protein phosphatase [Brevibacterium album]
MTADTALGTRPPLPVVGTHNFRDLGGLPLTGGGTVRTGRVFRSDALHLLDDAGRAHLRALGVRRIVDLRHDGELAQMPSALDRAEVEVVHAPVFAAAAVEAQLAPDATLDLAEIYRMMIETRGTQLALAAGHVVLSPGPVVFHCTAGKDRTGVLAALLLDAVGVRREAVVADYAATAANLAGAWAQQALAGRDIAAAEAAGVDIVGIATQSPAPSSPRCSTASTRSSAVRPVIWRRTGSARRPSTPRAARSCTDRAHCHHPSPQQNGSHRHVRPAHPAAPRAQPHDPAHLRHALRRGRCAPP